MLRLSKCVALALLATSVITSAQDATASASSNVSLRGACESKCTTHKGSCGAECEDAMGMALDRSFVVTCQTECAREAEYCVAGCSVLAA
ncbi:hypothetical protein Gpo141_00011487 [Globisporangium polare]